MILTKVGEIFGIIKSVNLLTYMDRYSYYDGEIAGVCMKCWYGIIIGLIFLLVVSDCLAQDNWLWVRNDSLLNPTGINSRGSNSPYLFDIDSDGDKDLVIGESGRIELYYNDGFPAVQYWRRDTSYFSSLQFANCATPAIGDFDLDGQVELVVGFLEFNGYPVDSIRVWRNIGTPQSPQWNEIFGFFNFSTYECCYPKFVDWDIDGDHDLIFRGNYGADWRQYNFFRNNGTAGNPSWEFDSTITSRFPFEQCGSEGFEIADFNDDGNYDLIYSWAVCDAMSSTIVIYINNGTDILPVFIDPYLGLGSPAGMMRNISAEDFDSDGDLDIIEGGSNAPLFYHENVGSSQIPAFNENGQRLGRPFWQSCASITAIDRNNDGDYDIGSSYQYWGWEYNLAAFCSFENIGNQNIPNLQPIGWLPWVFAQWPTFYMSSGDLTNDGYSDIVFGKSGGIGFLYNHSSSAFSIDYHRFDSINAMGQYYNPEVVDLNSDNRPDMILKDYVARQLVCFANTDSGGSTRWVIDNQLISGFNLSSDCVRETYLNRDSLIDLVAIIGQGQLAGFLNIGSASAPYFQYDSTIFASLNGIQFLYYDLADFDGDGDADIIANDNGSLTLYENRSTLSIEDNPAIPHSVSLCRAYPNPFNGQTNISFTLSQAGTVKLAIYDIAGRLVEKIADREFPSGVNRIIWDAKDKSSGIYFIIVKAPNLQSIAKLSLIK